MSTCPFAWHTLRTLLPAEWEITVYEKDPERGRLEFSTLDGPMASLTWMPSKRNHPQDIWQRTETEPDTLTAQSARTATCRTWTWTFLPSARPHAEQILADCIDLPSGIQEYTLHGIHARIPEAFAISGITVYPGNILLSFEDENRQRIVFRRWGLPDQLLRGKTPEDFFTRLLETEGFRIEHTTAKTLQNQPATRILFSNQGLTPWARLRLKRACGRGWIWRDPAANRLLTFEQLAPHNTNFLNPEDCFGKTHA